MEQHGPPAPAVGVHPEDRLLGHGPAGQVHGGRHAEDAGDLRLQLGDHAAVAVPVDAVSGGIVASRSAARAGRARSGRGRRRGGGCRGRPRRQSPRRAAGRRARTGLRLLRWSARGAGGARPRAAARRRRRPGRRRAASAAATGTPGRGTTRTSSCRTCPGTSWPARWPRSATGVRGWAVGDRVTVPFVNACGTLRAVRRRRAPGVRPPDPARLHPLGLAGRVRRARRRRRQPGRRPRGARTCATAAALGCRYATAFRAVVQVGRVRAGEWVAVHGCGGRGALGRADRGRGRRPRGRRRRRARGAGAGPGARRRARRGRRAATSRRRSPS